MSLIRKPAWIFALVTLIVSALFMVSSFVRYGEHYLNADISSDLVMAKFLNEEKSFISKDFYYSTEVKIANTVNIYQIMLALFPENWHLARLSAIIVNALIFAMGFIYMAKSFARDFPIMIICLAALLLPFSKDYMFLMTFGCFSYIYSAVTFFNIGFILRLKTKKKRVLRLVALIILNVIISSSGLKMVMFCAVPVAAVVVYLLCESLTKTRRLPDLMKMPEWPIIVGGIINIIAIGIGYLINKIYIIPNYHVEEFTASNLRHFSFADVLVHLQYLPEFFGFVGEVPLLSITGLTSIVTVLLTVFFISILVFLFKFSLHKDFLLVHGDSLCRRAENFDEDDEAKNGKEGLLSIAEKVIIIFCASSIFFGLLINVSTPKGRIAGSLGVGYYLPGFLMLIVVAFLFLAKISTRQRWVTYTFIFVVYLIFLGKSYATVRDNLQASDSHYEQTADWLVENGYKEGFATFWNGNVLSEASNGQIEVWALCEGLKEPTIHRWLQKVAHSTAYPKGKCFVYATSMQVWNQEVDTKYMELIAERSIVLPNDDRLYLFESGEDYMSHFR